MIRITEHTRRKGPPEYPGGWLPAEFEAEQAYERAMKRYPRCCACSNPLQPGDRYRLRVTFGDECFDDGFTYIHTDCITEPEWWSLWDEKAEQVRREAERVAQQSIVDRWNALHDVGAPVRFWTGARAGDGEVSVTSSRAWLTPARVPVVMVQAHPAWIALTHVEGNQ